MSVPAVEETRHYVVTAAEPSRREGSSPTGLIARRLARLLLAGGAQVTAIAAPTQREGWEPGVRVVPMVPDPLNVSAEVPAGAEGVFLAGVSPQAAPAVLDSAVRGGVRHIVLLSSHGPEYEAAYPPETWYWLAIEEAVRASGLEWTIIRPSAVMGSLIEGTYPATGHGWPQMIRETGGVEEARIDDGYYPFIHEDDLAEVAAVLLRSGRYRGQIVEAVGPPISTRERIRAIGRALGRDLVTKSLSDVDGRDRWRAAGWPGGAIEVTLYALTEYSRRLPELTAWTAEQWPSVRFLIGRPDKTYDDWALEHRDWFT